MARGHYPRYAVVLFTEIAIDFIEQIREAMGPLKATRLSVRLSVHADTVVVHALPVSSPRGSC